MIIRRDRPLNNNNNRNCNKNNNHNSDNNNKNKNNKNKNNNKKEGKLLWTGGWTDIEGSKKGPKNTSKHKQTEINAKHKIMNTNKNIA